MTSPMLLSQAVTCWIWFEKPSRMMIGHSRMQLRMAPAWVWRSWSGMMQTMILHSHQRKWLQWWMEKEFRLMRMVDLLWGVLWMRRWLKWEGIHWWLWPRCAWSHGHQFGRWGLQQWGHWVHWSSIVRSKHWLTITTCSYDRYIATILLLYTRKFQAFFMNFGLNLPVETNPPNVTQFHMSSSNNHPNVWHDCCCNYCGYSILSPWQTPNFSLVSHLNLSTNSLYNNSLHYQAFSLHNTLPYLFTFATIPSILATLFRPLYLNTLTTFITHLYN